MQAGVDVSTRPPSSTAGGAATPTSSSGSRRPSTSLGLVLRGRRRQARPPREGRRHPPDVRVLRAARRPPGRRPHIHVITGDGEHHTEALRLQRYYRALKARYEALVPCCTAPAIRRATTYPEKVDHCGVCRWIDVCTDSGAPTTTCRLSPAWPRPDPQARRRACATTAALGALRSRGPPRRHGDASLERLRHQAELQVKAAGARPAVELAAPRQPTPNPIAGQSGSPRCPRRRPATSSSTWRATPTRSKTASSTCSGSSSSTRHR